MEFLKPFTVRLEEIWFVSPYVTPSIFERFSPLGQAVDRAIEDGTMISLFTRWCDSIEMIKFFDDLEDRNVLVYYCEESLHSKVFYFKVDFGSLSPSQITGDYRDTAILGSANLTKPGLALERAGGNLELCYRVPDVKVPEVSSYVNRISMTAIPHLKKKLLQSK